MGDGSCYGQKSEPVQDWSTSSPITTQADRSTILHRQGFQTKISQEERLAQLRSSNFLEGHIEKALGATSPVRPTVELPGKVQLKASDGNAVPKVEPPNPSVSPLLVADGAHALDSTRSKNLEPTVVDNLLYKGRDVGSDLYIFGTEPDTFSASVDTIGTFAPDSDIETQLRQGIHLDTNLLCASTTSNNPSCHDEPPLNGAPSLNQGTAEQFFEDFEAAKAFAAVAVANEGASGALVTAAQHPASDASEYFYIATLFRTDQSFESAQLERSQRLGIYPQGNDYYYPSYYMRDMSAIAIITADGRSIDVTGQSVVTVVNWWHKEHGPEDSIYPEERAQGVENPRLPEIIAAEGYDAVLSTVRSIAGERPEGARVLNQQGYKALFLGLLQSRALKRLEQNRQEIETEKEKWRAGGSRATDRNFERLQRQVEGDDELQRRQKDLKGSIGILDPSSLLERIFSALGNVRPQGIDGFYVPPPRHSPEEEQQELQRNRDELKEIAALRQETLQNEPVVGLLDQGDVSSRTIIERLDETLAVIERVEQGIYDRDTPVLEFGPLVEEILAEMDPVGREEMTRYVQEEAAKKRNASLFWTIGELTLTVGALVSGGLLGIVLGVLGTALGAVNMISELGEAGELVDAANATLPGNPTLVEDVEAAQFHYDMALINMVLTMIDVGVTIWEVGSLINSAKRALSNPIVSDVFGRMSQEQQKVFADAIQLEASGKTADATLKYEELKKSLSLSDEDLAQMKTAIRGSRAADVQTFVESQSYLRRDELARRRTILVQTHGEELIQAAEENMKQLFDEADLFIAIPEDRLKAMLEAPEGRFRTTHEFEVLDRPFYDTPEATAANISSRKAAEIETFNYTEDFPADYRPISGFIASHPNAPEAKFALSYSNGGDADVNATVVLRVSDNVRQRVTITGDDSIIDHLGRVFQPSAGGVAQTQPSSITDPNISSLIQLPLIDRNVAPDITRSIPSANTDEGLAHILEQIANADSITKLHEIKVQNELFKFPAYFEVQFHGQVTLGDLEAIIYVDSQPNSSIRQLATIRGISLLSQ